MVKSLFYFSKLKAGAGVNVLQLCWIVKGGGRNAKKANRKTK
jgi:hypothetical protein